MSDSPDAEMICKHCKKVSDRGNLCFDCWNEYCNTDKLTDEWTEEEWREDMRKHPHRDNHMD